jgi:hypothetical protein
MYKIEKKKFGLKLTFDGFLKKDDMMSWLNESKSNLTGLPKDFGVFVDMRTLKPLPKEAQEVMEQGQKMFKEKGMKRSVVVLDNQIVTMQFRRIARETGISEWERYINANDHENWEQLGVDWIQNGIDKEIK